MLLSVARDPTIRISELADRVGIGERAVQKIIGDLEIARLAAGFTADFSLQRR